MTTLLGRSDGISGGNEKKETIELSDQHDAEKMGDDDVAMNTKMLQLIGPSMKLEMDSMYPKHHIPLKNDADEDEEEVDDDEEEEEEDEDDDDDDDDEDEEEEEDDDDSEEEDDDVSEDDDSGSSKHREMERDTVEEKYRLRRRIAFEKIVTAFFGRSDGVSCGNEKKEKAKLSDQHYDEKVGIGDGARMTEMLPPSKHREMERDPVEAKDRYRRGELQSIAMIIMNASFVGSDGASGGNEKKEKEKLSDQHHAEDGDVARKTEMLKPSKHIEMERDPLEEKDRLRRRRRELQKSVIAFFEKKEKAKLSDQHYDDDYDDEEEEDDEDNDEDDDDDDDSEDDKEEDHDAMIINNASIQTTEDEWILSII